MESYIFADVVLANANWKLKFVQKGKYASLYMELIKSKRFDLYTTRNDPRPQMIPKFFHTRP